MARLVVLSGLPGSGKSSIAREAARRMRALWLRVDSMDQAIWESGTAPEDLRDWTYRACHAVARDNLRLGLDVVADTCNPWMLTRDAWRDVGLAAGAQVVEVEIACSDPAEHRRRVETRAVDVPGLKLPDWEAVIGRDYHPWTRAVRVIDTAGRDIEACVAELLNVGSPPA